MSARPDTWMPMYWGDYARDTGHLSATGHGAYLMLIKHYWCSGGPLANDDDELWRVACCDSKKDWQKLKPKILRMFTKDGDLLRHKRVDQELARALELTNAKADGGRKGAERRWQMHGKTDGKTMGNPMGNPMGPPSFCQWQNDAPSQSHKESNLSEESLPRARDPSEPPETGFIGQEVATEMLQKLRKALKPTAYPPGRSATLTRDEQIAAVAPAPVKPAHLTPEQLAIARRKHA